MKQTLITTTLFVALFLFVFSCSKDNTNNSVKQGKGAVWLSGGLAYCAIQIHLDNGNKIVVDLEDIKSFKSGDRVIVKYREIKNNEFCSPAIDSKVIDIKPA